MRGRLLAFVLSSSSSSSSSPRRWVSVRGKEKKRNLIFSKSGEEGRRVF